jgi:hypothetical protein
MRRKRAFYGLQMTGESKCNCQRCGNPIAFPVDLHNTEIECPHCHKATTLLMPTLSNQVRALPPEVPAWARTAPAVDPGLITAGYVCAFLLPFMGIIIGIIILTKNNTEKGIVIVVLSFVFTVLWCAAIHAMQ